MLRHTLAATAILAAAAVPAFAQTGPTQAERAEVLHYDRDTLNYEGGADALLRRIDRAAERVCGERMGPMALDEHRFTEACQAQTADNAVADVGHPMLTARHLGLTPEVIIEEGPGKG